MVNYELEALEQQVMAEGHAWAERIIAELEGIGRAIVGGWPGTRSEAIRLVHARLVVATSATAALTLAEVEDLTSLMYGTAKRDWLRRAQPEHGECSPHDNEREDSEDDRT